MNLNNPLLLWHDPDNKLQGLSCFDNREISTYYRKDQRFLQIEDKSNRHKFIGNTMIWVKMTVQRTPNTMNTWIDKEVFSVCAGVYDKWGICENETTIPCFDETHAVRKFKRLTTLKQLRKEIKCLTRSI